MKTKAIVKSKVLPMLMGLALALGVMALVPQMTEAVYADDPAPTSGKCGDNVDWSFDTTTNILTISGYGDMYDYDENPSDWYVHYKESVEKVVVGEGVTRIGNEAFVGLSNLSNAELPTTLLEIGNSAFMEVGDHDWDGNIIVEFTVTLPDNLQIIGENAFSGSTITNIKIPKGVKKLERTFQSAFLETIDLGEVEEIGEYTFEYCWNLQSVTLPKTLKVIGIEAFTGVGLTEIIIPEGVTSIGGMWAEDDPAPAFQQCDNLKRIVLPSTLTFISEGEFNMCDNLEEIDFRGTQEQWKQLTAGINPNSELGKVINNPDIKKEYNYTKDLSDIANAKIVLSATAFTYNGKDQKPAIKTVTLGTETLKEGYDYVVTGSSASSKNVGTYAITISGKANYIGQAKTTYSINKAVNTVKAKGKTVKVKASKLKKKNQTVKRTKAITVTSPQGKVTYKKVSVGSKKVNKKYGKKITVNSKTGKITVKKGLKKGTYKVKVNVTAAGSANYNKATKTVTFKLRVK